jgi:transcriptional regulator with XRE-family HTH domain
VIEFRNMEATQAGKGIEELRRRRGLSQSKFAGEANIGGNYLALLEEGHEDKVSEGVVERILEAGGVRARGLRSDELKRILLTIRSPLPPAAKLL